jgi:hypothetical protein
MMRTILLVSHVSAGVVGLLTGPAAMAASLRGDRKTASAKAYRMAVIVLTATAAGLVAVKPALWPFLLLAAGTAAAVLVARSAQPLDRHVRLVCGSYVSLVTALLVVSWGSILAWVLPTVIGTALVERASRRRPPARTPSRSRTPSSRR